MDSKNKIVKDDINFLEYSNWTIGENKKVTTLTVSKPRGKYEVLCSLGLPKHFDKIILYCLLHRLYKEKGFSSLTLKTSRYEIAKNAIGGNHFGKNQYDRIMESLKRWKSIAIFFDGVFYEGGGYVSKGFSIIDEYTLHKESGELIIRFNESYIKQLNETKFYKLIDFEQYKTLQKSSSARLYELLVKTFKERNEWAINLQSFAEKMTFEKREGAQNYYSSDILRYLKPAIDEINKKTDLSFDFYFNKDNGTCVFKKVNRQKTIKPATKTQVDTKPKESSLAEQIDYCMKQFNAIPLDDQQAILSDIRKQPLFKFLPNDETRIFTYMTNRNKESIELE